MTQPRVEPAVVTLATRNARMNARGAPWREAQRRCLFAVLVMLLAAVGQARDAAPVYLSHLYVALDQETFDAVRNSTEIAALAGTEFRHTVSGERSWTGFYVYGRHSFIELYGAGELPDDVQAGDIGIGFGVERPGDLDTVTAALRDRFGNAVKNATQSRRLGTGDIPWFIASYLDAGGHAALDWWVAQTDPAYLRTMYPGRAFAQPLSRHDYMLPLTAPDQRFDDVVGIKLSARPDEAARLRLALELFGWTVQPQSGRGFTARGSDTVLEVTSSDSVQGITGVTLRFSPSSDRKSLVLGHARLDLRGEFGELAFQQPAVRPASSR